MADDIPPSPSRPKGARSATTGTIRGRSSPTSPDHSSQARPQKRARKAINCEPCRNSKLKCDRNRPCSSCVLRGTSALCYQDGRGPEGSDPMREDDHHHYTRIDPAQEIARLRHSINVLEAYVFPNRTNPSQPRRGSDPSRLSPKKEPIDPDVSQKTSTAPGILQGQGQGGLFAGPTSVATHLLSNETSQSSDGSESRRESQEGDEFPGLNPEYDRDLLAMLPSLEAIDGLINYYFEYCNWIYRHVNAVTFPQQWAKFKSGTSADRIVLATACALMAVAIHYLPAQHALVAGLPETPELTGQKFYEVSTMALQRRQAESKKYTLELVELLLVRCHYLTLGKTDSEEIWYQKGELVSIGTAMGLHRDPGKWRMHRDVAERRRWAWWHIILLERWQAFMFGRPISIASHHFDTQLPSYCDPALDKSGRLYLPNIALFRLAFILGDIMDDACSIRPVPYENVQANDRALTQWMDTLPVELDLDEYRVARNLASPNVNICRIGVQSVIIRTSYYHIRFTLHRPYASSTGNKSSSSSKLDPAKSAQSLEIAVGAADRLITMVSQARPDFLANSALAVPGHMNWGPLHCFSAAMFFSFQLIANPDQPGAQLFRASIRRAINVLEQARGTAVADKGYDILQALAPLYSADYPQLTADARQKMQSQILGMVRKLAFPYHDSHDPRRYGESPNAGGMTSSPATSNSVSPPLPRAAAAAAALPNYDAMRTHPMMSSLRTNAQPQQAYPSQGENGGGGPATYHQGGGGMMSPPVMTHTQSFAGSSTASNGYQSQPYTMHPIYDSNRYVYAQDDSAMWGASIGIGQGEWTQFLDHLRPDGHSRLAGA